MNKNFKDAAAMQFISKSHNEQEVAKTTKRTGNRKAQFIEIQKKIRETKSKALNLLIKPSTYAALKSEAESKDMSINEIANQLFEQYINSL